METWAALRSRRNVRAFVSRALEANDLLRIAEAGWMAPSAVNRQHRDFVVVTQREQLVGLAGTSENAGHLAGSAAAIVVVIPAGQGEKGRELDSFDAGQAVMAMMLAAADLGIGSCHASITDQTRARQILGIPSTYDVTTMLALGYPADRPLAPIGKLKRRPIDEVVHQGRW